MKARLVLDDCRRALEMVEQATNDTDFRVSWIALVTLLRAVGHVLDKVDRSASPVVSKAIDEQWKLIKDKEKNKIYWQFIKEERDAALKTYELGPHYGEIGVLVQNANTTEIFTIDDYLFTPLKEGPFSGEDARNIANNAIDWWDIQLLKIASNAKISIK